MGGVNYFDVSTSDFKTNAEIGWNLGLSVRGNFYNDFDMVYAIQFSENMFTISPLSPLDKEVKCKIPGAQISLLLSYKIVENHLSVEFGPMVQINGKIGMDDDDETTIINADGVLAGEIKDVSMVNFYPTIGITAGAKEVRAQIYYQYGINNLFGKADPVAGKVEGHAGILGANIIFYL
jgi:hypothetical protein